ncbi:sigma-70 family RNA polymerase sigma factor [Sporosarcina luteola]|uniref:sigma-70 family RNA polymerase sigma factor n=1 Tax=Bacillales TaxID=1385 RepID=UPI00203F69CC|nr:MULTISPECIES: sigma-70 family RNA polymerase sigma factor [Bacillales]MCM3638730.1 sigma-70 family RNA polymerase sigma factor [Sporosarcina luteola]
MPKKERLVKKAIKGDQNALQLLLKEEKDKLYKMAFIYMKNEHDALEVFQQTVLEVIESIHQLRNPEYFSTWVTRICINVSLKEIRKNKKIVTMESYSIPDVIQISGSIEERLDLTNVLYELDDKYKSVLVLRFFHDFTVNQIADILGCPEGTVKTNLHRGLALLKTKLKGVYMDERRNENY